MKLEDLLEEDEAILWQDRPEGPGTRRVPPGRLALVVDSILPATGLAFGALGLGFYALFMDYLPFQLMAGAGALAIAAFVTSLAIKGLKDRRESARCELHYVLTPRRLLIWDAARRQRVQILPGALDILQRNGRNLDLFLQRSDEAVTLYDLADIDAAERALSAVLIPPASAGPVPLYGGADQEGRKDVALEEGEELIWQGRPVRAPWDYWGVLMAFGALFGALLAAPLAWFLVTGEVMLEITLNGAPLTPDTPREQAAPALWGMGVMLAAGVAMMTLFTAHRLSQRYIVTSQRVIAGSTFPFTRSQELALARVLTVETAGRGPLRTTHLRYTPSVSLIGRMTGLGRISFHDYADPHGRLAARLSALIHPSRAARPDEG